MSAIDHYGALLGRPDLPAALCLTYVGLTDVDEAFVRYDGFPATRTESILELPQMLAPPELRIVVGDRLGAGVLLVSESDHHGSRPEATRRLSAGTVAASVCWGHTTPGRVCYAEQGRCLSAFEVAGDRSDAGEQPGAAAALLAGLSFGDGDARASALTFLERVAGARITADWLTADHPATVVIAPTGFDEATTTDLLAGFRDAHAVPRRALRAAADLAARRVAPAEAPLPDPDALTGADREALRAEQLHRARESLRRAVEWHWPAYEEDDDEPTGGGIDELVAEQQQHEADEAAAGQARRRAFGWAAARARLLADPGEAVRVTAHQAAQADPAGWEQLRDEMVTVLRTAGDGTTGPSSLP